MKVAIVHAEVPAEASKDELDVLDQVGYVSKALQEQGHEPVVVPLSFDLAKGVATLEKQQPDFVFNLVESLNGFGQFIYFAPTLLDYLKIPYSGSRTNAIYVTTNKVLAKAQLSSAGIPTPQWQTAGEVELNGITFAPPYIIKPLWEDASVGVDEESLVYEESHLKERLRERTRRFGECFVEAYVEGREFNLSLLAGEHGPEVLSPAEIVFKDYLPGKPRIVGYRAKWERNSFEYEKTVRNFEFRAEDSALIDEMREMARRCWYLFELRGYARVDFRVDPSGKPWVLEVNANPCISPDSGFVAAAKEAGLTFAKVIEGIVRDCDIKMAKGEVKLVPNTPYLR